MGAATTADDGSEPLLALRDVHTYYGESHVLEGVSLDVKEGEVVALVGRNGVGKTTTLRSILQLTSPREESIRYRDMEFIERRTHGVAGQGIGWIPEERRIFSELTVAENVRIAAPADETERARTTAFETFPDLERFSDRKAGTLSGGQQQILAIARGLVGGNDLLVDEPSSSAGSRFRERSRRFSMATLPSTSGCCSWSPCSTFRTDCWARSGIESAERSPRGRLAGSNDAAEPNSTMITNRPRSVGRSEAGAGRPTNGRRSIEASTTHRVRMQRTRETTQRRQRNEH
ncbi:ABC transporter ATP-binding protein [Halococcus saccharolyticus]|uniref:ABC transporter ATP-binding protein n=1 Tax=Halococcus saccharolyticus TaxID=62319 RepID=UPI0009B5BF87